MRILLLAKTIDRSEAHIFAGLKAHGVEIEAILDPSTNNLQTLNTAGIPYSLRKIYGRFDPLSILFLRKKLRSGRYDIIHCLSNRTLSNAIFASVGFKIPIVAYRGTIGHLHRYDPLAWGTYLNPKVKRIICVSNAVREYLGGMVSGEKLVTIYKGHDPEWYKRIEPLSPQSFGIEKGSFVVGCVANARPVKGIPFLIEAIKLIPSDKKLALLLVGELEDPTVKRLLDDPTLRGRIFCAGFRKDVLRILAGVDAFVMPSIAREGLPRAVIEAISLARPTIVTSVGGMPEIIEHEVSGLIVPPCDSKALCEAIERLEADRAFAKELGRKARVTAADKFNVKNSVDRLFECYQKLVGP